MINYYNLYYFDNQLKIIGHGPKTICSVISTLMNFLIFFKQNNDVIIIKDKLKMGNIYIKANSDILKKEMFNVVLYLQYFNNNSEYIYFYFDNFNI